MWGCREPGPGRRRRDYENAFLNADDYVLDAQVLRGRAAADRVQTEMWAYLVGRRSLSETIQNCELLETMLRVKMEAVLFGWDGEF